MATVTVRVGSSVSSCSWYLYNGDGSLNSSGQISSGGSYSWTMYSVAAKVVLSPYPASGYSNPVYYNRDDSYVQNLSEDNEIYFTQDKAGTLTATYSPPTTYTLSYNGNGATGGSTASQTGGTTYIVRQCGFTKTGHTFQYWISGSYKYYPGDSITLSGDTTLYAYWKTDTYTVSYNMAGGTGGPNNGTKYYGTAYTIPSDIPTKTGYSFRYWEDNLESGRHWSPGDSYTTNANVTFTARWVLRSYNVKYNANGGSGEPADQTKYYGVDLTLSSTRPTRSGYSFLGWGLSSAEGTAVVYRPGDTYTTNAGVVLYAVWKVKTYFYWHGSDSADATYFAVGKRIDLAVTAEAWNRLCDFINEVRSDAGLSTIAFSTVSAGDEISAVKHNIVSNAIKQIVNAGYGTMVPATVSTGDEIITSLYNGRGSLKAAINSSVDEL